MQKLFVTAVYSCVFFGFHSFALAQYGGDPLSYDSLEIESVLIPADDPLDEAPSLSENPVLPPGSGVWAYSDFADYETPDWAPDPPLPAPWRGGAWGGAGTGHAGPPDPYDIYAWNCHSATNLCTLTAPPNETRGALVCNPGAVNTPAHHSASWSVFDFGAVTWTCIYNWGQACCWQAGDTPPDISAGDGQTCAQWACGAQYNAGQTQALPAGQMVEIPGYSACVREIVTAPDDISVSGQDIVDAMTNAPANQSACHACCNRRANMWNNSAHANPQHRLDFLTHCREICDGFFGNGVSLGQQYGTTACVPATSWWSVSSYNEQCRGCCLDGAINGDYPQQDVNDCLGVCRDTYQ